MFSIKTIRSQYKLFNTILLCCFFSIVTFNSVSAQQNIRVQGVITSTPSGKPISGVKIILNNILITDSDIDGKFTINVPRDAKLRLFEDNHNELALSIDGRQQLSITMTERMLEMDEIVIVSKIKKLTIEPTEIEIRGNYFHLKTRFRIPSSLLKTDYRYIVQPTILNVTKQKRRNLRPVVIDGKNYSTVQHRYLNFNKVNDKLNDYIVKYDATKDDQIYTYTDSIYFNHTDANNDFKADCYLSLISYRSSKKHTLMDSITIAKGTQNVLRFFNYSLSPMNLDRTYITSGIRASLDVNMTDSTITPKPIMKLINDKGSMEMVFAVSKSTIDFDNPTNKRSIDKIIDVLQSVHNNEDATIKSISMTGYASPEGNLNQNQILAKERTQELFKIVTGVLSPEVLKYVNFSSEGIVQPWSVVAELVEQDSLPFAHRLKEIVMTTPINKQQLAIMYMPEYRTIIAPHYLPKLRKIVYSIEYSVFRVLTTEEIVKRYKQGEELSRYEFYRCILAEKDDNERALIEDKAIEAHHNFTWVLNRVAIRTLLQGDTNLDLQKSVLGKGVPMSMVYNQTLMALNEGNTELADSLINTISKHSEATYLKAVINALNGNFKKAYPVIAPEGGLNKILLLLGLKYDKQAFEDMQIYMQDANNAKNGKAWYIYALCANRVNNLSLAMMALGMALELDPLLGDIAAVDSDVLDVYELVKPKIEEGVDE